MLQDTSSSNRPDWYLSAKFLGNSCSTVVAASQKEEEKGVAFHDVRLYPASKISTTAAAIAAENHSPSALG